MTGRIRRIVAWWPPAAAGGISMLLWLFGAGKELWYSERFVQVVGARPWGDMFSLLKFENNPPLWFIVARVWQAIAGESEMYARLLTLLITWCFLVALWWCVKTMTDDTTARRSVLLASIAGFVVLQSVEYRMYSLVMLWSTIALCCAWHYSLRPERRYLVMLAAVNVLGIYTHYTYAVVAVFVFVWILWKRRQQWRVTATSIVATLACIAPWFAFSLWPILSDLGNNLSVQQQSAPWWSLVLLPFHVFVPTVFLEATWLFVVRMLVSVAALLFIMAAIKGHDANDHKTPARYLIIFIACCIVCSSVVRLTLDKYAAAAVPAVLMLVAIGIGTAKALRALRVVLTTVIIIGSMVVSFILVRMPHTTYREASEIVEQNETIGDRLLVVPFNDDIAVRPYYHGVLAVTGFFPSKDSGTATMEDNIRNNFKSIVTADTVERLSQYVGDARRVWVYYDIPMARGFWNGNLIDAWFKRNDFVSVVYRSEFHNVPPLLVEYTRATP